MRAQLKNESGNFFLPLWDLNYGPLEPEASVPTMCYSDSLITCFHATKTLYFLKSTELDGYKSSFNKILHQTKIVCKTLFFHFSQIPLGFVARIHCCFYIYVIKLNPGFKSRKLLYFSNLVFLKGSMIFLNSTCYPTMLQSCSHE